MAVANYHDVYRQFPPPYLTDSEGRPAHSWRVLLLPYLDQQKLYAEYDFSQPWDSSHNQRLAARMPRLYALNGEHQPGLTTTNYLAVVGPETVWPGDRPRTYKDVTDGASNTILIVENRGAGVHWMEPRDLSFAEMSFELNSPHGVSSRYEDPAVALVDGSVVRLEKNLRPETLRALLTVSGGERVGPDGDEFTLLPEGRPVEP